MRGKLHLIETGRAPKGAILVFTQTEVNAYARSEVPLEVPEGVRDPRVELGNGSATGYALIDFLRLRHAQGASTPWLVQKLIEGEKPVVVQARISSSNGTATVRLERVEISGLAVSGGTLDFLIRTFFLTLYPEAKINQPFALNSRIDHLEVVSGAARVYMKK